MRPIKKFYVNIPGLGRLIVNSTTKREAMNLYWDMGHKVGLDYIHLVEPVKKKPNPWIHMESGAMWE